MTKPSPQKTFQLPLIILLIIAITPVLNFRAAPITHQASPEIWLAAYSQADSYRGVPPDDGFRLQKQFKNDFISKNGSDYIVYEDVYSTVFACEAEYPITWAFPYPEQMENLEYYNYDFKEYRSSSFTEEQKTPININFKIVLTLSSSYHSGFNFLSLNVTCTSTQNHIQQSSIHVFQVGQQSIENEGETLEVYLEPSPPAIGIAPPRPDRYLGPPLVLPCRPASPEIKLLLEKRVVTKVHPTKEEVWKPLKNPPSQNYINYDPKIGFTVGRGLFYGNKIYGMYRCSVLISNDSDNDKVDGSTGDIVDSNQYVLVNVTSDRNNSQGTEDLAPFEPKSILRGSASFHFEWGNGYEETVLCCSGIPDKPPNLYPFYCSNELHCNFLKNKIPEEVEELEDKTKTTNYIISKDDRFNDSSDCSRTYLFGEKMFVVCHGQNVDFSEEFINLFSTEADGPIGNRSMRVQDEEEKDGEYAPQGNSSDRVVTSLTHYSALSSYETHTNGMTPSQKMFLTVGKFARSAKEMAIWRKSGSVGPSLLFQIHYPKAKKKEGSTVDSDDDFEDLDIFEDMDEYYHYDFKSITRKSLQIMEYDRDVYYTGESLTFMCFGLKYFYSTPSKNEGGGAYLRLNWENGTKQILDTDLKQGTSKIKKVRMLYRIVYLSGTADIVSGQAHQLNPLFSTSLTAQKGMDSVDCWMAQRNSTSWDTVSRKIKVEDSVPPKFLEGEAEESVYFYLGEVGHIVSCVVIGAKPFPSYLKVTKDGKSLNLTFTNKNANKAEKHNSSNHDPAEKGTGSKETEKIDKVKDRITIKISFSAIRHDQQGVYRCIAKNVNGTAIRTVNVFVLQKRGVALPVSLGIAGVLGLVFGGLALKHWRDKNTVLSLRTNHL